MNKTWIWTIGVLLLAYACEPTPKYNFNQHISPIIVQNCQGCHQKEGVAPFPLANYEDVAEHAKTIKQAVSTGYMPPWSADPGYRHYLYEKVLPQGDIDKIVAWVNQGYPKGDSLPSIPAHVPAMQDTFLRKPDLTVCMEQAWEIKGDNKDHYQTFVIPISLEGDRYAQAFRFRPGNQSAVHHAQVLVDSSGMSYRYDQQTEEYGFDTFSQMKLKADGILTGYLPGGGVIKYPNGTGKKLTSKSYIIFNVHYAPTPVPVTDQSCLDIYFSKEENPRLLKGSTVNAKHIEGEPFIIKANKTKEFHAIKTLPQDVSLIAIWPHMHFRGKHFEAYAKTPDRKTIPLIRIKDWDFNWQNVYFLNEMLKIPAQSEIHLIGTFDNRASNPANPILPPKDVTWGSSSFDEMLILGMEYLDYVPNDEHTKLDEY